MWLLFGGLAAVVLWSLAGGKRSTPAPEAFSGAVAHANNVEPWVAENPTLLDERTSQMLIQFARSKESFQPIAVGWGLSNTPGGALAAALFQLEGRPEFLDEWAKAFLAAGYANEHHALKNKAHSIRNPAQQ